MHVVERRYALGHLLDDFEDDAPVGASAARANDRSEGTRDSALAANHLADVVLRDPKLEDSRAFLPHFLDLDSVGIVHELASEVLEELSHRRSPS